VLTEDCPVGWRTIKRRVTRIAGAALSAALALDSGAFAQRPAAEDYQNAIGSSPDKARREVSLIATDGTGAMVPNSRITLTELTKGTKLEGLTDETGTFRFTGVPIGVYRLTIETVGFQTYVKDAFVVLANAQIEVNAVLKVGTMGGAEYPVVPRRTRWAKILHLGK